MRVPEIYHRYPRLTSSITAWLPALLLVVSVAYLGIQILRGMWDLAGQAPRLPGFAQALDPLLALLDGQPRLRATTIYELAPNLLGPLLWAGLALFVALYLRNALPSIRSSHVGLLVEFAGSWLPLRWEELRLLRVTQDAAGERFIILAEVQPGRLTTWHRFYGLLYGLRWHPGFLISSQIGQAEQLIQTIITQSERAARAIDGVQAVQLREDLRSPLFQLLLGPTALLGSSAKGAEQRGTSISIPSIEGGPIKATYAPRLKAIVSSLTLLLGLALLLSYLSYWVRFLALSVPGVRSTWPFSSLLTTPGYADLLNAYPDQAVPFMGVATVVGLPAPWWHLIAAHLMLLLGLPLLLWLRQLMPSMEARDEGMFVRGTLGDRGRLIPWQQVTAFKATEIDEERQVVLLQAARMPAATRINSLLYDGSSTPGVFIASQINNFEPLLGEALNQLAPIEATEGQAPILQQEARSWLIWLLFDRKAALYALVNEARAEMETQTLEAKRVLRSGKPSLFLALFPALLLLVGGLLAVSPPGAGLLFAFLFLWLFALLEWPMVSQLSMLLDQKTDGGYEGARAYYLYPQSQLPRILPLLAALYFQIIGLPLLAILAWIGAIVWAYFLTVDLCTTLYDWKGSQAILGGLMPVVWQMLLLVAFLLL
ncbi:MAG: hypothetical protein EI684_18245 [Candidatus Viridilinea halotolerans]|uniref:Uncharacterized protein n=1 Tax=Candidatus Viridilinea halotolerans TaxID=2491704 RepID=A0A426TTI6_9CHLR|nr:MAG: hypothetical protein EI684_18245 [Candidatus Viridilinea halotolerans]